MKIQYKIWINLTLVNKNNQLKQSHLLTKNKIHQLEN